MKNLLFVFLIVSFLVPFLFLLGKEKIEINTASFEELQKIIGIGPTLAQRIIDARPFLSLDDLLKVKGINQKLLQKIKEQDIAYVNPPNNQSILSLETKKQEGVVINELLPNPEGPDQENEWIELFNKSDSKINLSYWILKDTKGKITQFTIPKGVSIEPHGFIVFYRHQTGITLNNTEDGVVLIGLNQQIKSSIEYKGAPLGKSYSRTEMGWQWTSPTPGRPNSFAPVLSENENSDNFKNGEEIKEIDKSQKTKNPWFLFITVLISSLILSFFFLVIKTKTNKNVRTQSL